MIENLYAGDALGTLLLQLTLAKVGPMHSVLPTASSRQIVHDRSVYFRANGRLVSQAEAVAAQQGMTLSELMRAALRRQLRDAS